MSRHCQTIIRKRGKIKLILVKQKKTFNIHFEEALLSLPSRLWNRENREALEPPAVMVQKAISGRARLKMMIFCKSSHTEIH